jgi:hypothetical protein
MGVRQANPFLRSGLPFLGLVLGGFAGMVYFIQGRNDVNVSAAARFPPVAACDMPAETLQGSSLAGPCSMTNCVITTQTESQAVLPVLFCRMQRGQK